MSVENAREGKEGQSRTTMKEMEMGPCLPSTDNERAQTGVLADGVSVDVQSTRQRETQADDDMARWS